MHKHNKLMYNFVFPLLYIKPPTACLYLRSSFFSLFLSFFLSFSLTSLPRVHLRHSFPLRNLKFQPFFGNPPSFIGRAAMSTNIHTKTAMSRTRQTMKQNPIVFPFVFFLLLSRLINIPTARLLHRSPRGKEKKRTRFLVKLQ